MRNLLANGSAETEKGEELTPFDVYIKDCIKDFPEILNDWGKPIETKVEIIDKKF